MMPQFSRLSTRFFKLSCYKGLILFFIGLAKKLFIADSLDPYVNIGFSDVSSLTSISAWQTLFAYTFQLYFDFSGYSDMAIGLALFFGITLPQNFNSPYQAVSIQDFWRRWHITLSRWLRDYVYIPLGGSRNGQLSTIRNVALTFLLGGIWHGAGWTFLIWGAIHGLGITFYSAWKFFGFRIYRPFAISLTFLFVTVSWVFFRSKNLEDALILINKLFSTNGWNFNLYMEELLQIAHIGSRDILNIKDSLYIVPFLIITTAGVISLFGKNSNTLCNRISENKHYGPITLAGLIFVSILSTISTDSTPFLYFNF
jgi:D-alanyl-lipoteichoic acid acyltransferase DltB (MBOAT superfamily)